MAATIFTWLSDSMVATSDSSRVRSSASTWIATVKLVGLPSAQATSISRSGSFVSAFALGQSVR